MELSVDPITLLDLPVLRMHLLAPAIFLVVLPVADVVVAIAVDLSSKPIAALVLDLPLVDMAIRLREDEPTDAVTGHPLRIELTVECRPLDIHRIPVLLVSFQRLNRVAHYLEQPDRTQ